MKKGIKAKVISFTGYSGSGKTTFILKLIRELKSRGLKLAVIKHDAHEFDIDKEGKDSWEYFANGADVVSVFSKTKAALYGLDSAMFPEHYRELPDTENVTDDLLDFLPEGLDLGIIEGCRESRIPKIGFSRKATGKGMSLPADQLVAVITDEDIDHKYRFGIEDVKGVADFIEAFPQSAGDAASCGSYPKRVSVAEGFDILDSIDVPFVFEDVSLYKALGRVAAEEHLAGADFPPFRRAPLDGYAFIASDTEGCDAEHPVTLKITEEIAAGSAPSIPVTSGYAAKILTGAPVPEGADAIEKYESCEFTDEYVKIFSEFRHNDNIVPQGEDYHKGDVLVPSGIKLGAFDLSVLAMLGKSTVKVFKKPVVTFISTGSELVDAEDEMTGPAQIRNSSVFTLASMAEEAGAQCFYGGIVKDELEAIADALLRASKTSDMIVTTGGASAGDYDLVIDALGKIGAKILFWKARMKPGMACMAAVYEHTVILGLSGNPSSSAVTMELFGKMLVRKLSGLKDHMPVKIRAFLKTDIRKKSPMGRYVRGNLVTEDGKTWFVCRDVKGNGTTSQNCQTSCMAFLPPGTEGTPAGTLVEVYL